MNLTADRTVYNLGHIFAKGDATINANALINDVTLTGRLEYQNLKKIIRVIIVSMKRQNMAGIITSMN